MNLMNLLFGPKSLGEKILEAELIKIGNHTIKIHEVDREQNLKDLASFELPDPAGNTVANTRREVNGFIFDWRHDPLRKQQAVAVAQKEQSLP